MKVKDRDKVTYKVVKPPQDVFECQAPLGDGLVPLGALLHVVTHIETPEEGGIFWYYEGMKYPRKTNPTPEAVYANDNVKRTLMFFINSFSKKVFFLSFLGFAVMPWKMKLKAVEEILIQWIRVADYQLTTFYLKPERYCNFCRELRGIVERFLKLLGFSEYVSVQTAKIFVTLIQYDDAYRYRIEDIFSELSPDMILNRPFKAIKRAVETYSERETDKTIVHKFKAFGTLISLALRIPRIKRAFKKSFAEANYENLCLDEIDRYHTLIWSVYKFQGISLEDRVKMYDEFHPNHSYPLVVQLVSK